MAGLGHGNLWKSSARPGGKTRRISALKTAGEGAV